MGTLLNRFNLKHLLCGNKQISNDKINEFATTPKKASKKRLGYVVNYRQSIDQTQCQYISDLTIDSDNVETYNRYKEYFRNVIKQAYLDLEDPSKTYITIDNCLVISKSNVDNITLVDYHV